MPEIIDIKNYTHDLIKDLRKDLELIAIRSEKGFLDLGSSLQQATSGGKVVGGKITAIIGIAESDLGQYVMRRITKLLKASSLYFAKQRDDITHKSSVIKALISHLPRLGEKNGDIERMAKYLRAVALNIFVETSRSKTLSDHFSIIAEEIKRLSQTIITLSKAVRETINDSRERFDDMDQDMSLGVHELESLTDNALDSFYFAIQESDNWLQDASRIAKKNAEVNNQLVKKVGEIIVSLQFQDAMRQRLEHIGTSLVDLNDMASDLHGDVASSSDTLAEMFEFTSLLSDQLESIIQEAYHVTDQCDRAFQTIEEHMIDINDDIRSMMYREVQLKGKAKGQHKSHNKLIQTIEDFMTVKNTGDDLVTRMKGIYDITTEISSALEGQVGEIHQISMDAHIKALNAIIASNNLGNEGKTLSVLAEEMKGLSTLTDTFVDEINSILLELVSKAKVEDYVKEEDSSEYVQILEEMLESVPKLIYELTSHFKELKTIMVDISSTHASARESVSFIPGVAQDLLSQKHILSQMKDYFEPYRKQGAEGKVIHSRIEERYTMEKEREIHRKSMGFDVSESDASVPAEDDLGDNIELF